MEKVDYHLIADDPRPAPEILYHPATDNSGKGAYEIIVAKGTPQQTLTRFDMDALGLRTILALAIDVAARAKGKNLDNMKLQLQNALDFQKMEEDKDIQAYKKAHSAPPEEEFENSDIEFVVPEGKKAIPDMTEVQIVNELKDYGVTRVGAKKVDASHWLRPQLELLLAMKRQELYGD